MESLALAAAVVMLAIVGSSLLALLTGWLRWRLAWVAGPASILAGFWLAVTLPQTWPLAAWCVGVGVWAAFRLAKQA